MSYDLAFWATAGVRRPRPRKLHRKLVAGEAVDGLAAIDVEGFLAAIVEAFPGATRQPERITGSTDDRSFEATWSDQHVLVCCDEPSEDLTNRLVDIAVDHDCRLYDPQIDERFA